LSAQGAAGAAPAKLGGAAFVTAIVSAVVAIVLVAPVVMAAVRVMAGTVGCVGWVPVAESPEPARCATEPSLGCARLSAAAAMTALPPAAAQSILKQWAAISVLLHGKWKPVGVGGLVIRRIVAPAFIGSRQRC
jgi:hypothetical protein